MELRGHRQAHSVPGRVTAPMTRGCSRQTPSSALCKAMDLERQLSVQAKTEVSP